MHPSTPEQQPFIYKLTIYLVGFLLFCEWLRPMEAVTATNDVTIFFIYAAFCFFLSFLQVQWWISMPLKFLGLAFILDGMYVAETIFSRSWFAVVYEQIAFNIQMMISQEWWQMTPFFRSLLFLILLWLMSYLLYYWFIVARRMFLFVFMTIIYITVLDTFTIYDGQWAIIRTFVLAMVALGLTSLARELDKESIAPVWLKRLHVWAVPLIGLILFSAAAAYASPKLEPQWPDPVPYLQNATGGGSGGGVVQKVGYGEDDSRLGGGFVQDDTPVFRATADGDRYWRIESKDRYTGKGWEDTLAEPTTVTSPDNLNYSTYTDDVEVEEQTAFIEMASQASFQKLVYPYGIQNLEATQPDTRLRLHENTGEIDTLRGDSPAKLNQYAVNYDFPSFEYNQLREANSEDPQEIREQYLQLPENLPNRVRNLASQIVRDEDNRYDRAKAVESYFSSNGFEYSTTDIPVPRDNQDYVDQFLFESQIGYCDNFSTSMVVLLRSEGIPARWVKGFTSGERIDSQTTAFSDDEIQNVYQVTSSNAHSWVEVYFPDVGWVPFEPTKGFTNNADFYTDVDTDEDEAAALDTPEETPAEDQLGNPQGIQDEQASDEAGGAAGATDRNYTWLYVLGGLLLVAGTVLFFKRYKWMSWLLLRRYRKGGSVDTYEQAYQHLLKVLDHKGFKRNSDQTLREYAHHVDRHFQSNEMRQLTHHYERLLYRNDRQELPWTKITELWENLIKKALS
ncbi:DUF4129 domain-containing protein [Halobacillus fulvus]|nr:DUF4129 domain-containing protein [Halobacillus fulvus]